MGAAKQAALLESIAMRRLGTPEDIANVTAFLASDMAGMVNGQIISVDGGR
jgi:3-oxoacyl-[acyl-carrier protein] reductase